MVTLKGRWVFQVDAGVFQLAVKQPYGGYTKMKKLAIAVVALALLALVLAPAMAKDMPDVPFTHWAYDAVDELTDIGILQGYPDGTYKGQRTLTRYEFAEATVKLVHYLENYVDEKTAALESGVDAAQARAIARDEAAKAVAAIKLPTFDMTMDQVRAAAAASGAQAAKDALAGMSPGVTKAEVQAMIDGAVRNLVTKDYVNNLAAEFRADIQELGVDVDDLMYRVDQLETKLAALDARVTALENKPDKVTGNLKWRVGSSEAVADGMYGPIAGNWERFSNLEVRVNIDGKISDKAQGHIGIWRPDATYDFDERGTHIDTAYVDVQDGLFKGVDWRLGKQYYKTACGLTFDNNVMPTEGIKANFKLAGLNVTGLLGFSDFSHPFYGGLGSEEEIQVYSADYAFGKLGLTGTLVQRDIFWWYGGRWGIAANYAGLDVPFLGLKADVAGEYTEFKDWPAANAYYVEAKIARKGAQPGDLMLKATFSDNDIDGMVPNTSAVNYDSLVLYNGLAWDFLLGDDSLVGLPLGKVWSAALTKQLGSLGAQVRWVGYRPYRYGMPLDSDGWFWIDEDADLYSVSLTKELSKGVDAKLTYAQLNDKYWDEKYDYFAGAIDVAF